MKQQFWVLRPLLDQCARLPGDIVEMGVYRGRMFLQLAPYAELWGKTAVAIDSFVGMAEPGPEDADERGRQQYPTGAMNVGGDDTFRQAAWEYIYHRPACVKIVRGWVPDVFQSPDLAERRFCFGHIDLDQYRPTLDALEWLWPRMVRGGTVAVHDYLPWRQPARLATLAILQWRAEADVPIAGMEMRTRTVWFVRGWTNTSPWPLRAPLARQEQDDGEGGQCAALPT